MKKLYFTVCFLLLLVTNANAQSTNKTDSVVKFDSNNRAYQKVINTYDSSNNLICEVTQYKDEDGSKWINSDKTEYYEPPHLKGGSYYPMHKEFEWDSLQNCWQINKHNYFEYDANNDSILIYMQFLWTNRELIRATKTVAIVDFINKITFEEKMYWYNTTENKWNDKEQSFIKYTYNSNNKLTQSTVLTPWALGSVAKTITTYNTNEAIILSEDYRKGLDSENWEMTARTTYEYNANNQLTLVENEYVELGNWIKEAQTVYSYNSEGIQTSTVNNKWSKDIDDWVGVSSSITEIEYSNNTHIRTNTNYSWNVYDSEWQPYRKSITNYNNNNQVLSLKSYNCIKDYDSNSYFENPTYAFIFQYDDNNNLIKRENYEGSHTDLTSYEIYYYNNSPQSIDNETANSEVFVYYIGSNLIIDSPVAETIEIYSLSGKLINRQHKEAGKVALNIARQTETIIIKGSAGWAKKLY